jgi:hypothetical protein
MVHISPSQMLDVHINKYVRAIQVAEFGLLLVTKQDQGYFLNHQNHWHATVVRISDFTGIKYEDPLLTIEKMHKLLESAW